MTINAKLFEPVLKWLDAGAPHAKRKGLGFDMNHFALPGGQDFEGNECGTACCIAGALTLMNPEAYPNKPHPMASNTRGFNEIGAIAGLNEEQSLRLFFAAETVANGIPVCEFPLEDITPKWAARVIRHMIETGEVKWQ